MNSPKSTTRLTDRPNRTPTGKSSPWISASFSFHLFSFHQEFSTHINSYNINIDNFHANELVATVIGISQRLWLLLFAKHSRIYGLLHLFWAGFCYSIDWWMSCLSVKKEYHSDFSNKHRAHAYWFKEYFYARLTVSNPVANSHLCTLLGRINSWPYKKS